MRVLLTGGYGCIGSWIVRKLLERGDEAWIYDLKEDPRRMRQIMSGEQVRRATFVQGDVTDLAALKSAIQQHGITHVVHLAALQVPFVKANPPLGAIIYYYLGAKPAGEITIRLLGAGNAQVAPVRVLLAGPAARTIGGKFPTRKLVTASAIEPTFDAAASRRTASCRLNSFSSRTYRPSSRAVAARACISSSNQVARAGSWPALE